jgi:hypothetical protein
LNFTRKGKAMTTRFDNLVSDFYAVESMFWTLKPQVLRLRFPEFYGLSDYYGQRYPLNIELSRFTKELDEWRNSNHPPMARMLRDSLLGMAIGESRHATAWDRYSGLYELDGSEYLYSGQSRTSVYSRLSTFAVDDVYVLEKLFDCDGWCESFGGESWADITRYVQRYGELDDTTFIDTVVHAVHNGGCAFDKGLLVIVNSTNHVLSILNQKRDGSVLELPWLKVSEQVKGWIYRYKKLMDSLDFPVVIPEELPTHNGIEYDKIEWAKKRTLGITENPDRERESDYCEHCGEYSCECDYCDCEECQNNEEHNEYVSPFQNSLTLTEKTKGQDYGKTQKGKQEKAKKLGQDYDYKHAKVCYPLPLR